MLSALTLLGDGTALPPRDRYEPNDDAGSWAHALPPLPRTIEASLDYWDDNVDVYRVRLQRGQRLFARLTPAAAPRCGSRCGRPGTTRGRPARRHVAAGREPATGRSADAARLSRAEGGVYYLEAKLVLEDARPARATRSALSRRSP